MSIFFEFDKEIIRPSIFLQLQGRKMKRILLPLLLILCCLAKSTHANEALANELPIDNFTRHGDYLNMDLSPDGKHIAARVRINGEVNLVFLSTDTMQVVGGIRPRNNDEIHSAVWVNNERVVYQYAEKRYSLDNPVPTGELFGTDIDGRRNAMLFGFRAGQQQTGTNIKQRTETFGSAEILSVLEDNKRNILIIEYPWTLEGNTYYNLRDKNPVISRLNILTGRKIKVEMLPFKGATAFASGKGEVQYVTWISDENEGKAAFRSDKDSPWVEMSGESSAYTPVGISNDGSRVFLTARTGDEGFTNVFELNVSSGEKSALFSDLNASIEEIDWDPQSDRPAVAKSYPGNIAYHYLADTNRTGKYHKALVDAFGGQALTIESQSEDGELLLVHVTSSINPGEYYLFNTTTNDARFLWANRSWLDPSDMHAKTPITFTSADGLNIHGYITQPTATKEGEKFPMVVLIHGGPHNRDYSNFDSEVQLLANRGYTVLQVNFRGSTGYGGKFLRRGFLEWGSKMISDIIQGTQFAIENYPVDANRVCAYGASYGGYAALMASVKAPDLYKCAIGYVGIYDLNLFSEEGNVAQRLRGGKAYLEERIGTDKARLDAQSPVNFADKIKANVMLIHGEKDAQAPVIHSELMLKKLKEAGKKVPYLNFSRSGHGVYDEAGRLELYTALIKFLDENTMQ